MTRTSPTPVRRFVGLLAGWLLLFVATPGCVLPAGSWVVAILGLGLWGATTVRPLGERRRRALLLEWLANSIGTASLMWWVWWVVPGGLLYIGGAMGLYVSLGGGLARRLACRFPPGVAVALGWFGAELGRTVLVPPLGLGWFQLGHYAHAQPLLCESARLWGIEGLTFTLATLGGIAAEAWLRRGVPARASSWLGGCTLAVCLLAGTWTSPPATVDGPRLLIVQPGFAQGVKQKGSRLDNHRRLVRATLDGLSAEARAARPDVDLVCWGETMLQVTLIGSGVEKALQEGVPFPSWWSDWFDARRIAGFRQEEELLVRGQLLRRLPAGVSLLAGAVVIEHVEERIGWRNAVVLYDQDGVRGPVAAKRFLVPGAETMLGLEALAWVRAASLAAIDYVPDFTAARETGVLELATRSGAVFRIATTVCFDNAFLEAYTEPVAAGQVDFHLVASNEAWYRDAFEMDQMLAFSRVAAVATGRSVVRVTNSGVSAVFGPDGRELSRLVVGEADRSVEGVLAVTVPVPAVRGGDGPRTPYTVLRGPIRAVAAVLVLVLALRSPRSPRASRNRSGAAG